MSMEISHENELIGILCNKNAEEKVGTFLASLSGHFSKLGYSSTSFKLPMSRQDIGNYLGLSVETVSRIFSRLQKDGIISINNKSVELMDPARLSEISQRCSGFKSSSSAVS
jgi:CRP/FNR family transcriptional regulator